MNACMGGGGGGVQGFQLKFRDFGQPVQGLALSRLESMLIQDLGAQSVSMIHVVWAAIEGSYITKSHSSSHIE